MTKINSNDNSFPTSLILLFFIILAILLRSTPYLNWQTNPSQHFIENAPILVNVDGYYYLNNAKEILETNSLTPVDNKRAYPDLPVNYRQKSLLPTTIATLSKWTGVSINWVAIILPAVLGSLVLIPIYFFSLAIGGKTTAIGALPLAAVSPAFLTKSHLGWLDTDCLNVFFPTLCAYCFMQFASTKDSNRYKYLSLGYATFIIFSWWWDLAFEAVVVLALAPLAIALLCCYRPSKVDLLKFLLITITCIILLFLIKDIVHFQKLINSLLFNIQYITKESQGLFYNVGKSIQEQKPYSLFKAGQMSFTTIPALVVGICGLILLIAKKSKKILFLLPITVVGMLSIFYARRFSIFLLPICALSFGYFVHLFNISVRKKYLVVICYLLLVIPLFFSSYFILKLQRNVFGANIIQGMQTAAKTVEDNSLIWSWWDEGHPLVYWSGRKTINDGMVHGQSLDYFTALPFISHDQQFSANFFHFFAKRGQQGIFYFIEESGLSFSEAMTLLREILSKGPEEGIHSLREKGTFLPNNPLSQISYYFPVDSLPLYIFISERMNRNSIRWMYWAGSWDTNLNQGDRSLPSIKLSKIKDIEQSVIQNESFLWDRSSGTFRVKNVISGDNQVHKIYFSENDRESTPLVLNPIDDPKEYNFTGNMHAKVAEIELYTDTGVYSAVIFPSKHKISFIDEKIINTLQYRLFNNLGVNKKYFDLISRDKKNNYQIWKVSRDIP